ncbi:MAG: glycosyltransferase family 4 protein, partial [Lysobacter sp.]
KGALWFVQKVMPRLHSANARIELDVVGDGPERAEIEAAVKRASIGSVVHLWGDLDESGKAERLARCDLVLMPNRQVDGDPEGFGLVALEAAASERYVLAADLEGLRDAIGDPRIGSLLPTENADAWFEAIRALLADPAGLRAKGEAARAYASEHCSWRTMGLRYAERLDELV